MSKDESLNHIRNWFYGIAGLIVIAGVMGWAIYLGFEQSGYFVKNMILITNEGDQEVTLTMLIPNGKPEKMTASNSEGDLLIEYQWESTMFSIEPEDTLVLLEGEMIPLVLERGVVYLEVSTSGFEGFPTQNDFATLKPNQIRYSGGRVEYRISVSASGKVLIAKWDIGK
mgnify:CR=1 FL=1|tara:strand:+ start:282 stop:791 length:510 start_codon:yes stop_codon:yes gene_type:complete